MITIKNFTATDEEFKELARIDNLVNHDSTAHPDEDKNEWDIRDKSLIRNRLLLYKENILIGVMYYSQGRGENNKTTFFTLNLDPDYNNNGYRKLLYNKMLKRVEAFNCNKVHTSIYDHPNYEEIKKLITKEKFKLAQINREYSCDIRSIDIDKYKPLIKKLEAEGIRFYDAKKEMLNWTDYYKKLEALEWEIEKDIPIPDGIKHTRLPFKHWKKLCLDFYKNSYGVDLIAVFGDKYIGSTDIFVFNKSDPNKAWTGSLGVLKEFRRRGIAIAIKIKAIEILLKKGVTELRTDNEENNPMYKINVALGFKPVPFSLDYLKEI
jgi:GNAT superfamily N-acetyltransferase